MAFRLTILGSNSALPAYGRNHTAQVLEVGKFTFLIDCGEGTQVRLASNKFKQHKVDHIFISHLHGDHYLGLVGLLSTMHLYKRTKDLHIYAPQGLQDILITQFKYSNTQLNYKIKFTTLNTNGSQVLIDNNSLSVKTIPLDHRITCLGFLFEEKEKPFRINKEKLPKGLTLVNIGRIKKGEDALDENGKVIFKNKELTLPPKKARSYAYCSDTRYNEKLLQHIAGVDLLYHEATFLNENELRASNTFHSTAEQAGTMAEKAKAGQLIIGHFSARYKDISPFLDEAQKVFPNTSLAIECKSFDIPE